jgi:DNA helicase-2/ATP-dependent DNA helicase PcrA
MFDESRSDRPWLDGLTPAQRSAVLVPEGPLLVLAGAGTGKTRTLACRVARLLDDGVRPERILLLTFTRRAAADLMRRARSLAATVEEAHTVEGGRDDKRDTGRQRGRMVGGTFHAVGSRLLRQHGQALGLAPSFTVLDAGDAADLLDLVRSDHGPTARERRFPRKETLASIYSRTVSAARPLSQVLTQHWPWCTDDSDEIAALFGDYTTRKRALGVLDYDDLLLWWRALLDVPRAGEKVVDGFDHILVDEYQDTNTLQSDILRRMGSGHRNVTVVGDDAQSIYSFRAATVDNILRFPDHFPGTTVVRLEDNHRSTAPIVATANAVMAGAAERWDKILRSPRTGASPALRTSIDELVQADRICDEVLARREEGVRLRDQAVLMRTGHHSAQLEITLHRRDIPFVKYGGLKFLEAAHVKDLVALLRLLENPDDELAWFRVWQWFDGIGPAGARKLVSALGVGAGGQPLRRLVDDPPAVPTAAADEFAAVRTALSECAGLHGAVPPVTDQIERLRAAYASICARRFADAPARLRDLEQLATIARQATDRTSFLTDLVLDPPASTSDLAGPPLRDEDWLTLSTIHSAKGLEWDTVHVLGLVDGMIPSDMATGRPEEIDEERRLLYVAITRAKRSLTLHQPLRCYHQRFRTHDAHTYAQPSRFLDDRVLATLSRISGEAPPPPSPENATPAAVGAFLADLWQ